MDNNTNNGWICPKCGKVNAPWVKSCDCSDCWHVPSAPIYPQPYNPYYPYPYPYYPEPFYYTYSITCSSSGDK